MFQVSYKVPSMKLEIGRQFQHWKFLCDLFLPDQVIILSSVFQRNAFNNLPECHISLSLLMFSMPIKNVYPGGFDNLQFNRTKKSLLMKKNKHI